MNLRELVQKLDQSSNIAAQSKNLLSITDFIRSNDVPSQQLIISSGSSDTIPQRLGLLKELTKHGRDLRHFEHDIGGLLGRWILGEVNSKKQKDIRIELMQYVTNVIKFSYVYLSGDHITQIMKGITLYFELGHLRFHCLALLDTLCRFGNLPTALLPDFLRQLCTSLMDVDCESSAWNILKNLLVSHNASLTVNKIFEILQQNSTVDAFCVVGALYFLKRTFVEDLYQFHGTALLLTGFCQCLEKKDLHVTSALLETTLAIIYKCEEANQLDYLNWDLLVDIFEGCAWIWPVEKQPSCRVSPEFNKDMESSLEMAIEFHLFNKLFGKLSQIYNTHLVTAQKVKLIRTLLALSRNCSRQTYDFIVSSSSKMLWSSTTKYLDFVDSLIEQLYLRHTVPNEVRNSVLNNVLSLSHIDIFKSDQLDGILKKVILSINSENSESVLLRIYDWLMKSVCDFRVENIEYVVDVILRSVCNVFCLENQYISPIWVQQSKTVKNIGNPTKLSPNFKPGNLTTNSVMLAIKHLIKLFHLTTQKHLNSIAVNIYTWLCRIASWITTVHPSARNEALNFITAISCNNRNQILYDFEGVSTAAPTILSFNSKILGNRGDLPFTLLPHAESIYSFVAILKYETNTAVLLNMLDKGKNYIANQAIFVHNPIPVRILCETICDLLQKEKAHKNLSDIPAGRKNDIYLSLYQISFILFLYKAFYSKSLQDSLVFTIFNGLNKPFPISKHCILGLSLAIYELPSSSTKYLGDIIMKISQVTSSNLALPNLEFLASLASHPDLIKNLTAENYKRVFGIALSYLRNANSPHVSTFAYYVTQTWFLSLKLSERRKFVQKIITSMIANTEAAERQELDESVELILDMMVQHTYIDCSPKPTIQSWSSSRKVNVQTWSLVNTMITVSSDENNVCEVIFRRPAGITVLNTRILNEVGQKIQNLGIYLNLLNGKIADQARLPNDNLVSERSNSISALSMSSSIPELKQSKSFNLEHGAVRLPNDNDEEPFANFMDPAFLILQFQPYPSIENNPELPILLPNDEATQRAISVLDRTPSIDLHKIGVVFVDSNQNSEIDILANQRGSEYYLQFLSNLGRVFPLANNRDIYTGGLDTSAETIDGQYALCYIPDQRMSQVIFHVTTMMPNYTHDPQCTGKKRHIGNNFVTIVWNESGLVYKHDTIPGQFNFVQIIIEPIAGPDYNSFCFRVAISYRQDMDQAPPIPVLLSGSSLAKYVREISIYCNMMAQVFSSGETSSNARERLRQLKRIRKRQEAVNPAIPLDFTYLGTT
ncbi:Tuberous sclerosis 2-like protein [Boothiomyces sp. JEL0866]|nr:Tuberous sclerosis 2-like protein [Boothiomyces sp. JEL0866]